MPPLSRAERQAKLKPLVAPDDPEPGDDLALALADALMADQPSGDDKDTPVDPRRAIISDAVWRALDASVVNFLGDYGSGLITVDCDVSLDDIADMVIAALDGRE